MYNNCGCIPSSQPFEYPIISNSTNIILNFPKKRKSDLELKEKIICDYFKIINKLECGIQENLEFLLQKISLIDIMNDKGCSSSILNFHRLYDEEEDNQLKWDEVPTEGHTDYVVSSDALHKLFQNYYNKEEIGDITQGLEQSIGEVRDDSDQIQDILVMTEDDTTEMMNRIFNGE